jgi:integrase
MSVRLADVALRLERLDRLYGQRRIAKRTNVHFVRALPAAVLDELSALVQPGSQSNPFKSEITQWRVHCTFLLLLHLGLRRGEALTLRADFLNQEMCLS